MYVCMYVCTSMYIHTCMYVCMYNVLMYVCTYTCIYMYMYHIQICLYFQEPLKKFCSNMWLEGVCEVLKKAHNRSD